MSDAGQKKKLFAVAGLAALLLAGYLGFVQLQKMNRPSESDGKQFLADWMDYRINPFTGERNDYPKKKEYVFSEIAKFEKINAVAGEKDGIKFYLMDFKASGKCGEMVGAGGNVLIEGRVGEDLGFVNCNNKDPQRNTFDATGTLAFIKTEKNWRPNVKNSTIKFARVMYVPQPKPHYDPFWGIVR